MTSPALWYANRGTGVVLLALFTITLLFGLLSTRQGRASRLWPRFMTQDVHRYLSLLTSVLLATHVLTAVLDEYVDIRWWQALVPVGGAYRPIFLGLGAIALDATLAVVLTSLARRRIPLRAWRAVHLLAYAGWLAAIGHTWGIGTDVSTPWLRGVVAGSVALVLTAAGLRVLTVDWDDDPRPARPRAASVGPGTTGQDRRTA